MKSHTVPEKLLKQFAFRHPVRGLRLWRYQKGKEPYWDVSPIFATVNPGHFSDPSDSGREQSIETRLNERFENPVHVFIEQLGFQTFVFGEYHANTLAPYLVLLWHRSKARKAATTLNSAISVEILENLKNRDELLQRIAASWTLERVGQGGRLDEPIGVDKVIKTIDVLIAEFKLPIRVETSYADTMEYLMQNNDNSFDGAHWGIVRTTPDNPFVIGDAPVVTWHRDKNGVAQYGVGVREPDVEVLLPVSPTACLHVLPNVQRARAVITPKTFEVNAAEAAFAETCYTNICSSSLNQHLQRNLGRAVIGINTFSIRHKDYVTAFCDRLILHGAPPNV
jgi:hypothetical protein